MVVSERDDIHLLRTEDSSYCAYRVNWGESPKFDSSITTGVKVVRFATKEEKQKLFDAIKANGYRWNAETKTLEKLEVNKFDITALKPFESRVLVRDYNSHLWKPAEFGFIKNEKDYYRYYVVGGINFLQCIPYEGNEHLRGTSDECDEYYKNWK